MRPLQSVMMELCDEGLPNFFLSIAPPAYKVREISTTCSFDDEPDIATRGTGGTHRITHASCYWSVLSIAIQVVKTPMDRFHSASFFWRRQPILRHHVIIRMFSSWLTRDRAYCLNLKMSRQIPMNYLPSHFSRCCPCGELPVTNECRFRYRSQEAEREIP